MYDYKNPNNLVKWAKEQYKKPNRYKNGGIGRYDADGTRQFDCCGLLKCFLWHDYSTNNAKYYNKTQRDTNCEGLIADAKEKGSINTIPEIPGVLVYQKGHMGIYIGNGKVIESTAKKYDKKKGKIYMTYFKGDGKGCDGKRTTWTHWFKSNNMIYEEPKPVEPTTPFEVGAYIYPKEDVVLLSNAGYSGATKWTLPKGTKCYLSKYNSKNGLYMALKDTNKVWFPSAWTKEFDKFSLEPIIEPILEPIEEPKEEDIPTIPVVEEIKEDKPPKVEQVVIENYTTTKTTTYQKVSLFKLFIEWVKTLFKK